MFYSAPCLHHSIFQPIWLLSASLEAAIYTIYTWMGLSVWDIFISDLSNVSLASPGTTLSPSHHEWSGQGPIEAGGYCISHLYPSTLTSGDGPPPPLPSEHASRLLAFCVLLSLPPFSWQCNLIPLLFIQWLNQASPLKQRGSAQCENTEISQVATLGLCLLGHSGLGPPLGLYSDLVL